ncbi:hypothetical protein RvY_09025-2, partial [Ramazzottius varieornatus]
GGYEKKDSTAVVATEDPEVTRRKSLMEVTVTEAVGLTVVEDMVRRNRTAETAMVAGDMVGKKNPMVEIATEEVAMEGAGEGMEEEVTAVEAAMEVVAGVEVGGTVEVAATEEVEVMEAVVVTGEDGDGEVIVKERLLANSGSLLLRPLLIRLNGYLHTRMRSKYSGFDLAFFDIKLSEISNCTKGSIWGTLGR